MKHVTVRLPAVEDEPEPVTSGFWRGVAWATPISLVLWTLMIVGAIHVVALIGG